MQVYLNEIHICGAGHNLHLWAAAGRQARGGGDRQASSRRRRLAGRHAATAGRHAVVAAGTHVAAVTAATRHDRGGVFEQAREGQGSAPVRFPN